MHTRHIEALADAAADLDYLANAFPGPDRMLLKEYAQVLHDIASRMAQDAGLRIYVDDDEVAS